MAIHVWSNGFISGFVWAQFRGGWNHMRLDEGLRNNNNNNNLTASRVFRGKNFQWL